MIRNTGEWKWVSGVGIMGDGSWAVSSASLVSVPYIRLPKTRPKDVVSMHECYTYFLLMLSMACKCFFVFSINDIKRGWGESGWWGSTGSRVLPSQNFSSSSGETCSQDSGYDKCVGKPDTGVAAWFAWQGSLKWNCSFKEAFLTATNEICR